MYIDSCIAVDRHDILYAWITNVDNEVHIKQAKTKFTLTGSNRGLASKIYNHARNAPPFLSRVVFSDVQKYISDNSMLYPLFPTFGTFFIFGWTYNLFSVNHGGVLMLDEPNV